MTAPAFPRDSAIVDIDTAIALALRGDTGPAGVATLIGGATRVVAGGVPQNTSPPFVVIGNSTEVGVPIFNRPAADAIITLDVYTPGGQDKETCLAVYRAIKRRLDGHRLAMPSNLHIAATGTVELVFCIPDEDGQAMHASLLYRMTSLQKTYAITITTPVADSATVLEFGDPPFQVVAEVRDPNGVLLAGVTPTFGSTDPAVATVNAAGQVTAVATGVCYIIASYGGSIVQRDFRIGSVRRFKVRG